MVRDVLMQEDVDVIELVQLVTDARSVLLIRLDGVVVPTTVMVMSRGMVVVMFMAITMALVTMVKVKAMAIPMVMPMVMAMVFILF